MRYQRTRRNGDATLTASQPEGVTLPDIVALFHDAHPVSGEQLLSRRLRPTDPETFRSRVPPTHRCMLVRAKWAGIETPPLAYI